MHSALLAGIKSARLGTVTACLMVALMPLSSVRAQVTGQPGARQRAVAGAIGETNLSNNTLTLHVTR